MTNEKQLIFRVGNIIYSFDNLYKYAIFVELYEWFNHDLDLLWGLHDEIYNFVINIDDVVNPIDIAYYVGEHVYDGELSLENIQNDRGLLYDFIR